MGYSFIQAQKFINAYSAFLKRQGKLPIPGKSNDSMTYIYTLNRTVI